MTTTESSPYPTDRQSIQKAEFDPTDPQLEELMRAFSDALIQYTPEHFKEIHCTVREGVEVGQQALFYKISCPQYPEQSTTEPGKRLNLAAWGLQEFWAERQGSFPGFTMICQVKEDEE